MKYVITAYEYSYIPETFTINGIDAHLEEFIEEFDSGVVDDPPYKVKIIALPFSQKVLNRYDITIKEYEEIATALTSALTPNNNR